VKFSKNCIFALALILGAREPVLAYAVTPPASANVTNVTAARERINIDKDWRFAYGNADDAEKDFQYGLRPFFFAKAGYGDGPANADFSDVGWRKLDLPHDWAVELPFDKRGSGSHGSKAIGHAFPENSVGWYRKSLDIPASDKGRRISIEFDGVYRNSVVWVNGHYIGAEPSGYSGFSYDITDYVNYGGTNVIAVRVDATVEEGWFYEWAGIYRHVWLSKTAPLHVTKWGTFVKPVIEGNTARIDVDVTVSNEAKTDATFAICQEVFDADGKLVGSADFANLTTKAVSTGDFATSLDLAHARLWSLEDPYLYHLRTTIRQGDEAVDTYDTPFGVRTVTWEPDKGFSLNGKTIKLQGTDNHQDHAGVGVAIPDGLQVWRLRQLKSFGVNAYRASHNPPTPEMLDDADKLGMLVIDEHRMMGTTPEIRGQLERMVRRDRNHPSVILWSVGNEEWALEGSELGTHLAFEMQDIVRRMDPTRRTTVAVSASGRGTSVGADVIGFNYGAQHDVDAFHKAHPEKPAVMTEEGSTLTTRGIYFDDRAGSHLNAYDRQGRPGNSLSIEEGWRRVQARPWMSGMFIWTGFDYRGETTPFGWPAISSQFGMIDTTGALKDTAYYLKSVWMKAPDVHILPHWNWPGREGQPIDVRVYSNGDAVELFQDGKSLGRKNMVKDSHLEWDVPYKPGKLTARSYMNGKLVASSDVVTTGEGASVKLSPDKTTLEADGSDVSIVWVNVTDKAARTVPTSDNLVAFETTGPLRIIGVGNGDPASHEADKPTDRYAFYALSGWRSLAIDSLDAAGAVNATVDTSTWRDPTQWLPPESQPALTRGIVLRGQFARPVIGSGDEAALFIDRLDVGQKVYVNGMQVTPKPFEGGLVIALDVSRLKDLNSLTYVLSTPEGGVQSLFDRSVSSTKWGTLRVTTPAGPWQRHVFNGWAQVIVQSTGQAGTGVLKATSQGLRPALIEYRLK
jgi:beta-galactosidase